MLVEVRGDEMMVRQEAKDEKQLTSKHREWRIDQKYQAAKSKKRKAICKKQATHDEYFKQATEM